MEKTAFAYNRKDGANTDAMRIRKRKPPSKQRDRKSSEGKLAINAEVSSEISEETPKSRRRLSSVIAKLLLSKISIWLIYRAFLPERALSSHWTGSCE